MDLSERQVEIADLLREKGFLRVDTLAAQFSVTTQTIRRDLRTLCDFGLARRRHGGIERPSGSGNLDYASRQILSRDAKEAIAREVARHVPDNASLAFSVGSFIFSAAAIAFSIDFSLRFSVALRNSTLAACSFFNCGSIELAFTTCAVCLPPPGKREEHSDIASCVPS